MTAEEKQDAEESAEIAAVCKQLGEKFDCVVILASRHEGSRGTRTVAKGCGNWHAQYGIVREWLIDADESIMVDVRQKAVDKSQQS